MSAAPWGSASILLICRIHAHAWTGWHDGRCEVAILNANYIKARLEAHFPILYTRARTAMWHPEMIVDLRPLKQAMGVDESDDRREAVDGLRLPRADHLVPGSGTLINRADGERSAGRARSLLRRADRSARRSRP